MPVSSESINESSSKGHSTKQEIHGRISEYIAQFQKNWLQSSKPGLESDKYKIHKKYSTAKEYVDQHLNHIYKRQLLLKTDAILKADKTGRSLEKLLTGLDITLKEYNKFSWIQSLIQGPEPAPQPKIARIQTNQVTSSSRSKNDNRDSGNGSNDSEVDDFLCYSSENEQDDFNKFMSDSHKQSLESIRVDPVIEHLIQDVLRAHIIECDVPDPTHINVLPDSISNHPGLIDSNSELTNRKNTVSSSNLDRSLTNRSSRHNDNFHSRNSSQNVYEDQDEDADLGPRIASNQTSSFTHPNQIRSIAEPHDQNRQHSQTNLDPSFQFSQDTKSQIHKSSSTRMNSTSSYHPSNASYNSRDAYNNSTSSNSYSTRPNIPKPTSVNRPPVRPLTFQSLRMKSRENSTTNSQSSRKYNNPPISKSIPPPISNLSQEKIKISDFDNTLYIQPLALTLQPHQIDGVKFLWKTVVEQGSGGILAHAMGLGKTGQVYTFLNTLAYYIQRHREKIPEHLRNFRVLILCPTSLQQNWSDEFSKWTDVKSSEWKSTVHLPIPIILKDSERGFREHRLDDWNRNGGIIILSYGLFRHCLNSNSLDEEKFRKLLLDDPGASLVIADEAHILKESESQTTLLTKRFNTKGRVMLTGFPIQNRLSEYWCMVDFINQKILGSLNDFIYDYQNHIVKGLYDMVGTPHRKLSDQKLYKLTKLIQPIVHRMNSDIILNQIPLKKEYAICLHLSPIQHRLYLDYLLLMNDKLKDAKFFDKGHLLLSICNLPIVKNINLSNSSVNEVEFEESTSTINMNPPSRSMSDNQFELINRIQELAQNSNTLVTNPKFLVLCELTQEILLKGEKLIIFSRHIKALQAIEMWINNNLNTTQYLNLTGATPVDLRQNIIHKFNNEDQYSILLSSILVGGVGFNLTGASRVIIYDVGWNPSIDEQAVARAYRIGQTKPVIVYRLYTYDTWEARLFSINEHKRNIALRTMDSKSGQLLTNQEELKKYFKLPDTKCDELLQLSGDRLLDKVIQSHRNIIASCHPYQDDTSDYRYDLTIQEKAIIDKEVENEHRSTFGQQ